MTTTTTIAVPTSCAALCTKLAELVQRIDDQLAQTASGAAIDYGALQNVQHALYTRSKEHLGYVFEKLWGLVTDLRNLRIAFARVQRNRGARTVGIDRVTVRKVLRSGVMPFLDEICKDLRGGTYRPAPGRRVLIPKAGHPGKFRPLGIPTVLTFPLPSWQRLRRARCVTKGARRVR